MGKGTGIPEDEKEKIFNRRQFLRQGLSLFISREILSMTGVSTRKTGTPKKKGPVREPGAERRVLLPGRGVATGTRTITSSGSGPRHNKKPHVLSDRKVHRYPMTGSPVPVVLVHGWNSHPGVWNRLIPRLDAAHIPYSRFSHVEMADKSLPYIAAAIGDHIRHYRDETGYDGAVDFICHSVGTCITAIFSKSWTNRNTGNTSAS
ncbi:MAG: hypothetical protein WCB46_03675 [Methanoregula sp.]